MHEQPQPIGCHHLGMQQICCLDQLGVALGPNLAHLHCYMCKKSLELQAFRNLGRRIAED
jgi:hypothetical protein